MGTDGDRFYWMTYEWGHCDRREEFARVFANDLKIEFPDIYDKLSWTVGLYMGGAFGIFGLGLIGSYPVVYFQLWASKRVHDYIREVSEKSGYPEFVVKTGKR